MYSLDVLLGGSRVPWLWLQGLMPALGPVQATPELRLMDITVPLNSVNEYI
jgi:hypothetical protein